MAACGLVAGTELPLTVYPFILRGVTLAGIDSAKCPRPQRLEMWQKLSGPWRVEQLDDLADEVTLDELPDRVQKILAGEIVGRTLVVPRSRRLADARPQPRCRPSRDTAGSIRRVPSCVAVATL